MDTKPVTTDGPVELPEPLLSDKVSNLEQLFLNGRLIGKLRDYAAKLADRGVTDAATTKVVLDRYKSLREHLIDAVRADVIDIEMYIPAVPDEASLEHVAFLADQTSNWVDALGDVDSFLIGQLSSAVGALNVQDKITVEFKRIQDERATNAHGKPPQSVEARAGTYL